MDKDLINLCNLRMKSFSMAKIDKLEINSEKQFFVIPVKTGIQFFK